MNGDFCTGSTFILNETQSSLESNGLVLLMKSSSLFTVLQINYFEHVL